MTTSAEIAPSYIPGAQALGGFLGAGGGLIGGAAAVGVYGLEKTADNIKDLVEKTGGGAVDLAKEGMKFADSAREDLKDHVEHHADNVLEAYKETRQGAENVAIEAMKNAEKFREGAQKVTEEAMRNTAEVLKESAKAGVGIKSSLFSLGVGIGDDASLEEKLKAREELIVRLEKEVGEKNERIKKLEETQQELTAKIVQVALK